MREELHKGMQALREQAGHRVRNRLSRWMAPLLSRAGVPGPHEVERLQDEIQKLNKLVGKLESKLSLTGQHLEALIQQSQPTAQPETLPEPDKTKTHTTPSGSGKHRSQ